LWLCVLFHARLDAADKNTEQTTQPPFLNTPSLPKTQKPIQQKPQDELVVTVCEPGLAADDELGSVRVRLPDLVEASAVSRWTGKEQPGYMKAWMPLGDGDGAEIELEVEFLPNW
jgi:hypothetical protein